MGYCTMYKLAIWQGHVNVSPSATDLEHIKNYVKEYVWYGNEYMRLVDQQVESIRGNIADDWVRISRQFPTLIFALYGQGEDHGDVWVQYSRAGYRQKYIAMFPDPSDRGWIEYED